MYAVFLFKIQTSRLWLIATLSMFSYFVGFSQNAYTTLSLHNAVVSCAVHPLPYKSSLRGKIVDKNQNPVANVKVTISELGVSTYTNSEGNYAFSNFPEGVYTIVFEDGQKQKELSPLLMPKQLIYNIQW